MSFRVLSERAVLPGHEAAMLALMRTLQREIVSARGFVSYTALRDADDSSRILVMSEWQNRSSWMHWHANPKRAAVVEEMRGLLFGPQSHRTFVPLSRDEDEPLL